MKLEPLRTSAICRRSDAVTFTREPKAFAFDSPLVHCAGFLNLRLPSVQVAQPDLSAGVLRVQVQDSLKALLGLLQVSFGQVNLRDLVKSVLMVGRQLEAFLELLVGAVLVIHLSSTQPSE